MNKLLLSFTIILSLCTPCFGEWKYNPLKDQDPSIDYYWGVDSIDDYFLLLDQTTPQSVVPVSGTTFGVTYIDVLPTLFPGAFVLPAISFTNSNVKGSSQYFGAIRGGILAYAYGGFDCVLALVHDYETGQYASFTYNSSTSGIDISINGITGGIRFENASVGGVGYASIYGETDASTEGLLLGGHTYVEEIAQIRSGTITRDANGYITQVARTGGKTYTVTRDGDGYVSSFTDGTLTWTITRNGDGYISSWAVT